MVTERLFGVSYHYIFTTIEQRKNKQENQNIYRRVKVAGHLQGHKHPFFSFI